MYVGWGIHHFRAAEACGVVQRGVAPEVRVRAVLDQQLRHLLMQFGFGVSDFGFRISGFGVQVSGSWVRVSGLGFLVSGFWFRVSGFKFRVSGTDGRKFDEFEPRAQRVNFGMVR